MNGHDPGIKHAYQTSPGIYPGILGKGPWFKLEKNFDKITKLENIPTKVANVGTRFIQ